MVRDDIHEDNPIQAYWCVLLRSRSLAYRSFQRLIQRYKNPRNICHSPAGELLELGLSERTVRDILKPDWKRIEKDLKWLQCNQNHLITIHDEDYPELLRHISTPPIALYVKGDPGLLKSLQLSLVGDERGSTEYNQALGNRRASAIRDVLTGFGLAENRFAIVSFGEQRPSSRGSSEAAWAQNRRGEFVLTGGANAINPGN